MLNFLIRPCIALQAWLNPYQNTSPSTTQTADIHDELRRKSEARVSRSGHWGSKTPFDLDRSTRRKEIAKASRKRNR